MTGIQMTPETMRELAERLESEGEVTIWTGESEVTITTPPELAEVYLIRHGSTNKWWSSDNSGWGWVSDISKAKTYSPRQVANDSSLPTDVGIWVRFVEVPF